MDFMESEFCQEDILEAVTLFQEASGSFMELPETPEDFRDEGAHKDSLYWEV